MATTTRRDVPARPSLLRRGLMLLVLPFAVLPVVTFVFVGARCFAPAPRTYSPPLDPPGVSGYTRPEAFTHLALPQRQVIYAAEETARFLQASSPSDLPYVAGIAQYWRVYGAACDATRGRYPFEVGTHLALALTGVDVTIENGVKAIYENTLGLLTGWLFTTDTDEDRFATIVATEYAAFVRHTPWYRFPFFKQLNALWARPAWGPHVPRKWERRAVLSAEYTIKGAYAWLRGFGARARVDPRALTTAARVTRVSARTLAEVKGTLVNKTPTGDLVALPRGDGFTLAAIQLMARGGQFVDIAGNREVVVTVLASANLNPRVLEPQMRLISREVFVTRPDDARLAVAVDVARLPVALRYLRGQGVSVERIHDY